MGGGGAERQVSYICHLPEIGKVISLEPVVHYAVPEKKLQILFPRPARNLFNKAFQILSAPYRLKKIGVNKQTNLFCFLQLSYIIGYLCKVILGCRYTICIRTNPMAYYKNVSSIKIPFFLYKHMLRSADCIIANSRTTALQLKNAFGLPDVKTIANGYDLNRIKRMSAESNPLFDKLFEKYEVLVHTGRLEYDKGQWHLLRIFADVLKKDTNARLIILGTGSYLSRLLNLCESLSLSYQTINEDTESIDENNKVFFCGFQKNPYAFYPKAKLFLFPSIFEGLPNAPIEALICKLPCLLSDCISGPKEILFPDAIDTPQVSEAKHSKYGILLPPFDGKEKFDNEILLPVEEIWSEQITSILSNKTQLEAMRKSSIEVAETYDASHVIEHWKIYCKIEIS